MGKESRTKLVAVDKPTPEPVALPTMLEPSELAYQTSMLTRIRREQAEHQALLKCWGEFVSAKYSLSAQDRIDESGRLIRVPEPEKPEP